VLSRLCVSFDLNKTLLFRYDMFTTWSLCTVGTRIAKAGDWQQGFNSSCCSSSHAPAQAGVPALATVRDIRLTYIVDPNQHGLGSHTALLDDVHEGCAVLDALAARGVSLGIAVRAAGLLAHLGRVQTDIGTNKEQSIDSIKDSPVPG